MRAIIDEGVPRQLLPRLAAEGCQVARFPNSWKGLRNGRLLDEVAAAGYTCLVTCDKNMEWQRPARSRETAVVVLPFQKLIDLEPLAPLIATTIQNAAPGTVNRISAGRAEF